MAVLKVLEILASSSKSWDDAVQKAVTHAGKSVRNIRSVNVGNMSATVVKNKLKEYRVNVSISFEVE
jgi:dodecin